MKLLTRLFTPLRRAATAFFKHDLAVQRGERGLQIVLKDRAAPTAKPSREELGRRKESAELVLMRQQLGELLAGLPEARSAMRHLVFVEHALAKKGIKALHKVPLDVLQRALTQFEGLVTNWSPEGLANLRSKMAVAIIDRENMDPEAEADAYRTAAVLDTAPPPSLESTLPEVSFSSGEDDEALAAAYAALGNLAPPGGAGDVAVEMSGELGSVSAKAALRDAARGSDSAGQIKLRELQP
jgi:hypothetical protein